MYDSYPKDFKGFPKESEIERAKIIREIKAGHRSPGDLDLHDKEVSKNYIKEHQKPEWKEK